MRRSAQLVYHAREAFLLVLGFELLGLSRILLPAIRRSERRREGERTAIVPSGLESWRVGTKEEIRTRCVGTGGGGGGGIDNTVVVFLWELPMVAERSEATGTLVFFVGAALIANCFKVPF